MSKKILKFICDTSVLAIDNLFAENKVFLLSASYFALPAFLPQASLQYFFLLSNVV